jgi:hypothetical protein
MIFAFLQYGGEATSLWTCVPLYMSCASYVVRWRLEEVEKLAAPSSPFLVRIPFVPPSELERHHDGGSAQIEMKLRQMLSRVKRNMLENILYSSNPTAAATVKSASKYQTGASTVSLLHRRRSFNMLTDEEAAVFETTKAVNQFKVCG